MWLDFDMAKLVVISGLGALFSLIGFNYYYWLKLYPLLKEKKETSLAKVFFLWGQQIVDVMKFEEIASNQNLIRDMKITKRLGALTVFFCLLFFVLYLINSIKAGSI
jgi:hypothetical protein